MASLTELETISKRFSGQLVYHKKTGALARYLGTDTSILRKDRRPFIRVRWEQVRSAEKSQAHILVGAKNTKFKRSITATKPAEEFEIVDKQKLATLIEPENYSRVFGK